jgi:branched-chain amino acid transport system substrate-binding protein
MKRLFVLSIVLASIVSVSNIARAEPTTSFQTQEKLPLGLSTVLSGPWAGWGQSMANGFTLGNEMLKDKYAIDIQDDHADTVSAKTIMQSFSDIRHMKFSMAGAIEILSAIGPVAAQNGVTVLCLGSMTKAIAEKNPTLVSFFSLADTEAHYLAPYIASRPDLKTISILHGSNDFGEAMGESLDKLLSARGVKVLRRDSVAIETMDFRSIAYRLVRNKPDALFVHLSEASLVSFIRQARQLGYKGEIYTVFVFENEAVRKAGGEILEGVRYTYPVESLKNSAQYVAFYKRYKERFGIEPTSTAAVAYDAVHFLDEAITKCENSDSACVLREVSKPQTWEGIAGKIILKGDRTALRPHGLKEFRQGEFRWVKRELEAAE